MARMTTTYTKISGLNRALRELPKAVSGKLRDAAQVIAGDIAGGARDRAAAEGGVAGLVAPTLRAARDRVPVVRMGNSTPLPTSGDGWERKRSGPGQTIGDVIWGAEFGSNRYTQFERWRGSGEDAGYFLFPSVRAKADDIHDRYSEALNDALQAMK